MLKQVQDDSVEDGKFFKSIDDRIMHIGHRKDVYDVLSFSFLSDEEN